MRKKWAAACLWLNDHPAVVAVGVALVGMLVSYFRMRPVERGVLYAEDGSLFLQTWISHPSPLLIIQPYTGYLHFIPWVLSGIVSLLPIAWWAQAVTWASAACVGWCSGVAWYCCRDRVEAWPTRLLVATVPVLLPLSGVEPLGTLCNVHWWAFYVVLWTLLFRPPSRVTAVVLSVSVAFWTLSEIQTSVLAPLALWVAWKRHENRLVGVTALVGMACQFSAFLAQGRTATGADTFSQQSLVRGLIVNVAFGPYTSSGLVIGDLVNAVGLIAGFAPLLVTVMPVVFMAIARSGWRRAVLTCYLCLAGIFVYFIAVVANGVDYYHDSSFTTPMRYGMGACFLLLSASILGLDSLARRRKRAILTAAGWVALLVTMQLFSFTSVNQVRTQPEWRTAVTEGVQTCSQGNATTVELPGAPIPDVFYVTVPCDRLI